MNELVALDLEPGPDFVAALRRIFDEGDACLPIDARLAPPARRRLLELLAPGAIVGASGLREHLEGGKPVEPGDALVMATSGTTGDPKGVVLTHSAIEASAIAVNEHLAVDPATDAFWACLPLAHVGGLSVVTRSMVGGVRCEVVAGFSVEGAIEALAGGATVTSLVPTALRRLSPAVTERFRAIVLGGQAPPEDLPPNVFTTYGMTETASGVVYDGVPLSGVEVRVSGSGEIELRGPMLLRGYRDGTDPKDNKGWLATGDSGEIDADGRLKVFGRIGDLVITGGENVWPGAVEPVLERHPSVERAAVGGRPDAEWGERVTAYVVLSDGHAFAEVHRERLLAELRELVRSEIAPFAAPRELVVVDRLPTTAIGKVRRDGLISLEGPSVLC